MDSYEETILFPRTSHHYFVTEKTRKPPVSWRLVGVAQETSPCCRNMLYRHDGLPDHGAIRTRQGAPGGSWYISLLREGTREWQIWKGHLASRRSFGTKDKFWVTHVCMLINLNFAIVTAIAVVARAAIGCAKL